MLGGAAESGEGRGGARRLRQGGTLLGARGAGSAHVVWVPQRVVAAAAATGEGEEVARRRWFEFVRESPCERMGQRVAEVATGYGKATDPAPRRESRVHQTRGNRSGLISVWAGTKPAQIQNSNLNLKK